MSNPQYVKVDDKLYKINTDFRVALECEEIARDKNIGDFERALAIIYKLFGIEGLECNDLDKLINAGIKYISLGKEKNSSKTNLEGGFELDINKCKKLIASSFKFDYNYDPYTLEYLHWYDFYNDLENLSTSEFGNCCALNRIISILNQDGKDIKDSKTKKKLIDTQKELREKYCVRQEKEMTKEQEESAIEFYRRMNINIERK